MWDHQSVPPSPLLGGLPSYGCNLRQGETILTFQPSSPGLDSYNFVVKSIKLNYNLPPPSFQQPKPAYKYQILAGNLKLDTFIRVIFKHWAQLLAAARNMDRKSIKIQQLWRCNDCYLSQPIRLWSHFFYPGLVQPDQFNLSDQIDFAQYKSDPEIRLSDWRWPSQDYFTLLPHKNGSEHAAKQLL